MKVRQINKINNSRVAGLSRCLVTKTISDCDGQLGSVSNGGAHYHQAFDFYHRQWYS